MTAWQLQDAKARFTKFLNTALKNGPQIVTRRGVEMAVLVPIHDWRRLEQAAAHIEKFTAWFGPLLPESWLRNAAR